MTVRLPLIALGCAGCVWIPDAEPRLDVDGDGVPVEADCDDNRADVTTIDAWDGTLACGMSATGDTVDGTNRFGWTQCAHPFQREDLVFLGGREQVWRLVVDTPTEVRVRLATDLGFVPATRRDTAGIAFVAFDGPVCQLSACAVALPIAPAVSSPDGASDTGATWTPEVHLRAEPGQPWYVVVSGGPKGLSSPYRLDVDCG